jgi:hypothetical protein
MLAVSQAPIARSFTMPSARPQISSVAGSTIIRNHEQIATVAGSVSFAASRYRINPGLSLFAWLSGRARGYEKYRLRKFRAYYVPANTGTTTVGEIYVGFDYDPVDAAPSTLAALSAYETMLAERVYNGLCVDASVKRMFDGVQHKKIRCGPVAGDLQLYDAASVIVGTISCADTSDLGQLWVEYEVELISPQLEPSAPLPQALSMLNLSSAQTFTSTMDAAIEFDQFIVDGLEVSSALDTGVLTMPCGVYLVSGVVTVQDSSAEALTARVRPFVDGALHASQHSNLQVTVPANGYNSIPVLVYFTSDGTTTFEMRLTLTGAAGTLKAVADFTRIAIRAI